MTADPTATDAKMAERTSRFIEPHTIFYDCCMCQPSGTGVTHPAGDHIIGQVLDMCGHCGFDHMWIYTTMCKHRLPACRYNLNVEYKELRGVFNVGITRK